MNYYTLVFNGQINSSIQVGDIVLATKEIPQQPKTGIWTTDSNSGEYSDLYYNLGEITTISIDETQNKFSITIASSNTTPSDLQSGFFIFFLKAPSANTASLKGYYSSFKFKNNSIHRAELFSSTCNFTVSSK